MKYLDGSYYVEVKYKRDPPTSLGIQYQVQNETQIHKNQKVIKNENDELIVKNYHKKKQPIFRQQKFKPPNCPSCKRKIWLGFDNGYCCQNCEYFINKQKHQLKKNVLRQDHNFSTRLNYANKKIRESLMNMVNTTYKSTKDMINNLQQLKGKTKLKFYKKISNYYNEMKK